MKAESGIEITAQNITDSIAAYKYIEENPYCILKHIYISIGVSQTMMRKLRVILEDDGRIIVVNTPSKRHFFTADYYLEHKDDINEKLGRSNNKGQDKHINSDSLKKLDGQFLMRFMSRPMVNAPDMYFG